MLKKIIFFLIIIPCHWLYGQYIPISENAETSILTIGPGSELYDKFGHSAFRIKDDSLGYDFVFNYGTYDWNTPNFYTKFARGKLLYQLSVSPFEDFITTYKIQNRWVKQQTLNLSYTEKEALFNYLQNNAKPENAKYKYDFFFDNCATKIRDVLSKVLKDKLTYDESYVETPSTFRELIQQNVYWNTWGSLGMDVATGSVVDIQATAWQHQFLPEYVYKAANKATLNKNNTKSPLVLETKTLYQNIPRKENANFITSPFFIFSVISILILIITLVDYKHKKRSRFLDACLFVITGVTGIILTFLWFGTDHSATANNYNLLWAFPFTILFCTIIGRKKPKVWLSRYLFFLVLLLVLLFIHWLTGVQVFAVALIPLFIALLVRNVYVITYLRKTN